MLAALVGGLMAIKIEIARLSVEVQNVGEHYRRIDAELLRLWGALERKNNGR